MVGHFLAIPTRLEIHSMQQHLELECMILEFLVNIMTQDMLGHQYLPTIPMPGYLCLDHMM